MFVSTLIGAKRNMLEQELRVEFDIIYVALVLLGIGSRETRPYT